MAQQLIFTSAVIGLNPGSSGYCTLARSEAMRDAVVARLEQWSIYTHNAGGQNPVVCAYRILNLRGSVFHVLTRIVDSGLDYTGRTNFLAHHLVFQPHEIHGACSPAEVFLQWPGWMNQWQGAPRYLEDAGLSLHNIPRSTKMPANTWKEWTGDAGAATLLVAENGSGNVTARSADTVVPASSETVLPYLYAESLHLIDPKGENAPVAWAVPFTTFLQSQDEPGDFRWRGLSSRNRTRAAGEVLIDLENHVIPSVAEGPLTEYARTNQAKAAFLPGVRATELTYKQRATEAPQATVGTLAGVRPRPLGSTIGKNPRAKSDAVTDKRYRLPAWVLIGLICVVPVGLAAGWWIARHVGSGATIASQPASPTPSASVADASPSPPNESLTATATPPNALAEATASPTAAAMQDEGLARQQAQVQALRSHIEQVAGKKASMETPQVQTLDGLRQQAQMPDLDEAAVGLITSQLNKLEEDLEKNKRAKALLDLFPECPVYISRITTGESGDFIYADASFGRELTRLNEAASPENSYNLSFASVLSAPSSEIPSKFQRSSETGSIEAQVGTGRIVFEDKKVVFKGCLYPLIITIQSAQSKQDTTNAPVKFVLIALQANNPEIEKSKRAILRFNDFLQIKGKTIFVREAMLEPLKAKLAHWKSPKDATIPFQLGVSLKSPTYYSTLESLLAQARVGQGGEAEKYQTNVANASYSVDLDAVINWVQSVQTNNHPPQVQSTNTAPTEITAKKLSSQSVLSTAFDEWIKTEKISLTKFPNYNKNGRAYYDFLRNLLTVSSSKGETIAHDKLPPNTANRLEAIKNVPGALMDNLQDPGLSKPDKEKMKSLADRWRDVFKSDEHKAFLDTDSDIVPTATPSTQIASRRQNAPDYGSLLTELQKNPEDTFDVSLQAILTLDKSAPDALPSNKNVKIVDFAH